MKGYLKTLSVVLMVAALIGVGGGYQNITDALSAKDYWEQKSIETDENLDKLEDGLNQLGENEEAYYQGRIDLDKGKADLAEGEQTLADGYAEYYSGKALLDSKTDEYYNGLASKPKAKEAYDAINKLMNGYTHDEAVATVADATGNDVATIEKGYQNGNPKAYSANKAQLAQAKDAYDNVNMLMAPKDEDTAVALAAQSTEQPEELIKAAYENVQHLMDGYTEEEAYAAVADKAGTTAANVGAIYINVKELENGYSKDKAVATVAAKTGLPAANVQELYDGVAHLMDGYLLGEASQTVAAQVGITAAQVEQLYGAVRQVMGQGQDLDTACAYIESQTGVPAAQVKEIYQGVQELVDGYTEDKACATVAAKAGTTAENVQAVYEGVQGLIDGYSPEEAYDAVAATAGIEAAQVQALVEGTDELINGYSEDKACATVAAKAGSDAETVKAAYEGVRDLMAGYSKEKAVATVAAAAGKTPAKVEYGYSMGDPATQKAQLAALENAKAAYTAVKELEDGYSFDKAVATVANKTGNSTDTVKLGYENGDPAAQAAIQAKLDEYTNGLAKLAAAEVQLAEGEAKLADGRQQLADGEKKLAEFEDGRDQVIDGLKEAVNSKPDGELESIKSRLGDNFSYMKNNVDLDIDKGHDVVGAARDYKADNTVAVTDELTARIYSAIAGFAAAALCLLAGLLGLFNKNKGAGILAAIGAVVAAGATIYAKSAGLVFSSVAANEAGTSLGWLAVSGTLILAAVVAVHAISELAGGKAVK